MNPDQEPPVVESVTRPADTVGGLTELERTWEPDGPRKAEIVLIHGLAEHSGRYERTGSLLAEAGFGVTSFDWIGHGASAGRRGHLDDWSLLLDQTERHVLAARRRGLPVVLLGHSGGGLVALEYALSERPATDLLVVSAPWMGVTGRAALQRLAVRAFGGIFPRLVVPIGLEGHELSRDPAVGEAYFSDPLNLTRGTLGLGKEFFAAMDRARENAHRLSVPTLVLHGGLDTAVPPELTAPLGALASVERKLYPGLRHELFNEPEGPEVVADVIGWIDSRLSSTSG